MRLMNSRETKYIQLQATGQIIWNLSIFFFLFFLLKQSKFNHKTNLSLIFLNQVLIEIVFGYFKNGNLLTIQFIIKLFLILNLFHFFINFKNLMINFYFLSLHFLLLLRMSNIS